MGAVGAGSVGGRALLARARARAAHPARERRAGALLKERLGRRLCLACLARLAEGEDARRRPLLPELAGPKGRRLLFEEREGFFRVARAHRLVGLAQALCLLLERARLEGRAALRPGSRFLRRSSASF